MKSSTFWVPAGLALAAPALIIALFAAAASRSPGDAGAAPASVGLVAIVASLVAFIGLAAWAVAAAKPKPLLGRVLRRLILGVAGLLALDYGLSILFAAEDGGVFFVLSATLLLLAGVGAFAALVTDLWPRAARSRA